MSETRRDKDLKEKYQITSAQWDQMYERQKGKCPICGKRILKPGDPSGKRAAAVDHDHKSGRVRGLLDFHCNFRVVRRMTPEKAKKISDYLNSDFDGRTI